jgi:hypothetical protein
VGGSEFWRGSGDAQVASRTEGSGNVGSDILNAVLFSKSEAGVQWLPKASRRWSVWNMHRDAARLITNQGDVSSKGTTSELMRKLMFTQKNFWRSMATYGWRDGRGGCATITAGAGTATVTLASPSHVHAFEIGDVLVGYTPAVYDAAQPGVLSAVLPGTVTVTARNPRTGTLTLNAVYNVAIAGGADGDVIGHLVYRQPTDANFSAGLYGFGTWCAMNPADTTVTALGVNRAIDPYRRGGYFSDIGPGATTRAAIDEVLRLSNEFSIPIDRIYAPASSAVDIQTDFTNQTRTSYDEKTMRFGAGGASFMGINGVEGAILTDSYLYDLRSAAKVWVGMKTDQWGYVTTPEGIGWAPEGAPEFQGAPVKSDSAGNLQADYGGVGNIICADPASVIVVYSA